MPALQETDEPRSLLGVVVHFININYVFNVFTACIECRAV